MILRRLSTPALATLILCLAFASPLAAEDTPKPTLAISTSPQSQPITLTLNRPTLRYQFTVDSLEKGEPQNVAVTASPFRDAAGDTIPVRVTFGDGKAGEAHTIGALQSLPVVIEADFPNPGSYTSSISLIYNDRRWTPVTLSVTRTAPDLDVADLAAGNATLGLRKRGSPVLLETGIYEKTGQGCSLPLPQLVRFNRKETQETSFTAPVSFTVYDETNKPPKPPIQVGEQKASRHLFFKLDGIGAGEYTGLLRFTPPGAAVIEKPVSVFVREPWIVALIWIGVGVAISFLIRRYLLTARPRLVVLARVESLTADLAGILEGQNLTPEQKATTLSVLRQVEDVPKDLQLESITLAEADARLDILEQKVPLLRDWLDAHQRASASGNISDALKAAFVQVIAVLNNRASDEAAIKAARAALIDALAKNVSAAEAARAFSLEKVETAREAATRRLHRIWRQIRSFDGLATLIILAIACLMGINTLWTGNMAWGTPKDIVIAVLWGLGLHQVAFTGIDALRGQLIKSP